MPTLIVQTAEGARLRRELAGAGSRFSAGLLDLLLLGAGFGAAALVVALIAQIDPSGASRFVLGLFAGGALIAAIAYPLFFHLFDHGRTPGKRALGLRVASADGNPATPLQLVLRALIQPIDVLLMVPIPLGLIVILLTPRQQRLGDIAAGTLVLRDGEKTLQREPLSGKRWSTLEQRQLLLAPGLAARIGPEDLALLRGILGRTGMDPAARERMFDAAGQHYAAKLDLGPLEDPRTALEEIYLFAREAREPA